MLKDEYPSHFLKLQAENSGGTNIITGFTKTELFPFDPSKLKERLSGNVARIDIKRHVSEADIDILTAIREKIHQKDAKKRKRLQVESGKSVSSANFVTLSTSGITNILEIRKRID